MTTILSTTNLSAASNISAVTVSKNIVVEPSVASLVPLKTSENEQVICFLYSVLSDQSCDLEFYDANEIKMNTVAVTAGEQLNAINFLFETEEDFTVKTTAVIAVNLLLQFIIFKPKAANEFSETVRTTIKGISSGEVYELVYNGNLTPVRLVGFEAKLRGSITQNFYNASAGFYLKRADSSEFLILDNINLSSTNDSVSYDFEEPISIARDEFLFLKFNSSSSSNANTLILNLRCRYDY